VAVTYSKTVATNRAAVRLALVDTHEDSAALTDDELDYLLVLGGSVAGAINEGLRVAMAHAALRGDVLRTAAIESVLRLRGGELPTVSIGEPNLLPMDDGFTEPA